MDEAIADAKGRPDSPNLPELLGAQTYIPVDAALPSGVNFGPRERALMVKESIDICEKQGVLGSGYIPKIVSDQLHREHQGPVRVLPVRRSRASS